MDICWIIDNPETPDHPVIGATLQALRANHRVRLLDIGVLAPAQALTLEAANPLADLYLLKSHTPQALDVAHTLEKRGALVVNSCAATQACQDRLRMTRLMQKARLPWPRTWSFPTLAALLAQPDLLAPLPFPCIVKSARSYRGDLVSKRESAADLHALAAQWGQEPVIIQEYAAGDGWDRKFWVIDRQVFAARRPGASEAPAAKNDLPLAATELPHEWSDLVLAIGRVFQLHLYGVDLLVTDQGPVVVDVNSFPGFRGAPDAAHVLTAFIERLGRENEASR